MEVAKIIILCVMCFVLGVQASTLLMMILDGRKRKQK